MAKKPKEKTLEQLHDEIMDVFVGVSFKNSVLSLVDTLSSVTDFLDIPITDVIEMLIETDRINKKYKEKS
jgi:hypothetical protein